MCYGHQTCGAKRLKKSSLKLFGVLFQETLATLNLGAPGSELSERNKRTIGILRQLFPSLTQVTTPSVVLLTITKLWLLL